MLQDGTAEAVWLKHCADAANGGQWDEAGRRLADALRACPASAKLWFNQGVLHRKQDRPAAAMASWKKALGLNPEHLGAHLCMAAGLLGLHAHQAAAHAREAARLSPMDLQALLMLARAELADGEVGAAAAAFDRAALAAPGNVDAETGCLLTALISARGELSLSEDALARLRTLANESGLGSVSSGEHRPGYTPPTLDARMTYLAFVISRQRVCDWRERPALFQAIQNLLEQAALGQVSELDSFMGWEALALGLSEPALQQIARLCCAKIRRVRSPHHLVAARTPFPQRPKIRLAYLSYNYGNHPTAYLVNRVFAAHDRQQFEVFAYGINPDDGTPLRRRIEAAVDTYVDCAALAPEAVAKRIVADNIDILVGLGGYADGPVVDVALFRPAPLIVNYMSYMGTMGSGGDFDYHITDAITTPMSSQPWYDEVLVHISPGHLCYDDALPIDPVPTRQAVDLPDDALVLCGFNNSYKIEPKTFDAWCAILHALPQAVLWLYLAKPDQAHWLTKAALQRGIAAQRLVFTQTLPNAAHLARLTLADIYLDTFCYNGHTTILDALYCGVPAISLLGEHTVARFGSSTLYALGMSECVANETDDYIARVIHLANNPAERMRLKAHLLQARGTRLPFNVKARAAELEEAYHRMYHRAAEGLAPASFSVV